MRRNFLSLFAVLLFCVFTSNIKAQNFSLVEDLNTSKDANLSNNIYDLYIAQVRTGEIYDGFNYDKNLAVLKGVAYFSADDGIHGTELWRSDNTAAGTYMVKDITPGSDSSFIQSITATTNKIFFTVNRIVYVSDGTEEGTLPLPGVSYNGDITTCLTPVGNKLYFFTTISRLWKTDGTAAGTSLVVDLRSKYNYAKDWAGQLTNVNGTLFFTTGIDNVYGAELWKSDGTDAGTVLVKDIYPGAEASLPARLTAVNNKLYFSANDGSGVHLWVSDGSASGTMPVMNKNGALLQGPDQNNHLNINPIVSIANVLYFTATTLSNGNELYKYDISKPSAGIVLVKDITKGAASTDLSNLTAVDSTVYFSELDVNGKLHLWKSGGKGSNTVVVKSFGSGSPTYFSDFSAANDRLYFSFYTITNGYELWSSDGTLNGTTLVKDIYPGNHSSKPTSITYLKKGTTLFSANDGTSGAELWRTNGSESGTTIIKNINVTSTASFNPDIEHGIYFNNKLFFAANTPAYGNNLYASDGTVAGTQFVKDINFGNASNPANFAIFKNELYFSADSAGFNSVFKTDGTASGTVKVFSLEKRNASIQKIAAASNFLYVFYNDVDSTTTQLWASNGTTAGFYEIENLSLGSGKVALSIGDTLFFQGVDAAHGAEFWSATNEPGSAKLLSDIFPGTYGSSPTNFIAYKHKIYFEANSISGTYLYTSNGTISGTKEVFEGYNMSPMIIAKNKLFFSSDNFGQGDELGIELYVSDGTTSGTSLLKDIYEGPGSSYPGQFAVMNNILYFEANDGIHGSELWKSNGTLIGTTLVKDILPGASASYPNSLCVAGNQLYFIAEDSLFKRQLFVSNGTASGTKEINDAGIDNVSITAIAGDGNKLLINGYTYALGNELYSGSSEGVAAIEKDNIANAISKQTFTATITPNPAQDVLKLLIGTAKTQNAQIVIFDALGKIYLQKDETLNKGSNMFSFPVNFYPHGIYVVYIIAEDKSSVQLKFVK